MDTWMKIGTAVLLGMMIFFIWPAANRMMKNRTEAQPGDWQAAIVPILLVMAFVALIMYLI